MKTLSLAVLLTALAAASAQAQRRDAVYSSDKAVLVVFQDEADYAPTAVWYNGKLGKYLLRGEELFALGHDFVDETTMARLDIWNLRTKGVEYSASSNVRTPALYPWKSAETVAVVEGLIRRIPNKLPAAAECAERSKYLGSRASGQALNASSLEIAARLAPGSIKDAGELAKAQGDIDAAKDAVTAAKNDCKADSLTGYFDASENLAKAAALVDSAQNILVWLPVPDK